MTNAHSVEARRPPRNALALNGGLISRLVGRVQLLADLQVWSVSRHVKSWLSQRHGQLLEAGCGDQPYQAYVPTRCDYVAIDKAHPDDGFKMIRRDGVVYYSDDTFPVESGRFDSLFHTEVLEHIYETTAFLSECRRVLKPNGEMFFTIPFQARYHFKPHDYFRFTPAALQRLLSDNGFERIHVEPRGNDIVVACYKVAAIGFRWAYGSLFGKLLFLLTVPLTLSALLLAHAAMAFRLGSQDDCLGYSVTARRRST